MRQGEEIGVLSGDDKSPFMRRPIKYALIGCSRSQNAIGVNPIDFRSESSGEIRNNSGREASVDKEAEVGRARFSTNRPPVKQPCKHGNRATGR